MSVINTQPLIGSSGNQGGAYNLERSLRLRSSASAYLSRTPASAGNRKTYTISMWVKRGTLGAYGTPFQTWSSGSGSTTFFFMNTDALQFYSENSSTNTMAFTTTQVFRDPSAWYHIVIAVDTTQATNTNRVKIYVNGSQVTAFSTATYPTQNLDTWVNNNNLHGFGRNLTNNGDHFDGYMTDVYLIDGQQLTPSSFGETDTITGVWKPKAYSGTYGTNGFYLKFTDVATTSGSNAGLGKDFSGNGNYYTTNNISVTAGATYDSMTDVPTLTSATVANYTTWNPLTYRTSYPTTYADGNLKATFSSNVAYQTAYGTIPVFSGKYYWEVTVGAVGSGTLIGISQAVYINDTSTLDKIYSNTGSISGGGSGSSYTTNDVIGVALDIGGGTVTFYKNNTSQGSASLGSLPASGWTPYAYGYNGSVVIGNFGQQPFVYTPPSGYKALNTYNLPDSTIVAGNKYMDVALWTGTNSTGNLTVSSLNFKPDLVWSKIRNNTFNHQLTDSNRGVNKTLISNSTAAEDTTNISGAIASFNSNGFTANAGSSDNWYWNYLNGTYAGWAWQAGQGTTSSNTSGSITSTVSVNPTAGFSIVTYTGTGANATVGHGLGVAPSMVIVKNRTTGGSGNWLVYHTSIGAGNYLQLNTTIASTSDSQVWNSTAPTSSVFSLGTSGTSNNSGTNFVAYCWSEIAGFSKFGSYIGNSSTDGPFVYTGFRPRFILIKCTSSGYDWVIYDTATATYNVISNNLWANLSNAEYSSTASTALLVDTLSNGFKIRGTNTEVNNNGLTYVYAAFAENPFKNSLAR